MKIVLTNLSDDLYIESRKRLNKSASIFGINEINSYSFSQIRNTPFYWDNQKVLDHSKGTGAWLWKPYIIIETIKTLDEGDIVIYCDSGMEIVASLEPLIKICREKQPVLLFANGNLINSDWTKRDTFLLMGCDSKKYWYSLQCDASFSLFRKSVESMVFLETWLKYCTDERILTDRPNILGKRNLPGFVEHRWDQSVLSILCKRFNISLFRMPSQFGNHYKSLPYRITGEFNCKNQVKQRQLNYYTKHPYTNSPYFQLLNHHRHKNKSGSDDVRKSKRDKLVYRIVKKRLRYINGMISRLYNLTFTK